MAYTYFKIPFDGDDKILKASERALKGLSMRYAVEHDYEYITVDLGTDTDGTSEAQLRMELRLKHLPTPYAYVVDHKVRDDHFVEPK